MKKYQINDRVFALDNNGWTIPGTITDKDKDMYRVEYDCGGYDWLISAELRPLEYHAGDYVETPDGIGKVLDVDRFFMGTITVSYGKNNSKYYYDDELKPAPRPSFLARLFGKGVYLYD